MSVRFRAGALGCQGDHSAQLLTLWYKVLVLFFFF